jgi:hypothetical protein
VASQQRRLTFALLTGAALLIATAAASTTGAAGTLRGSQDEHVVLSCNSSSGVTPTTREPRHCTILPPGSSFNEGVNLGRLHWRHWGSEQATFRGIDKGFHLPYLHLRVRGYAYRLRRTSCVFREYALVAYTRLRYTIRSGSYVVKPDVCYGDD